MAWGKDLERKMRENKILSREAPPPMSGE